jgi:hypothetical protein
MAGFSASLKLGGDPKPLAADLTVDQGQLVIKSSDQLIGSWGLKDLAFQRVANGFKVDVEGEQIILEMNDSTAFEEAIGFKRRGGHRTAKPSRREKAKAQEAPAPARSTTAVASPAATTATDSSTGSFLSGMLKKLDAGLEKAERAYGSLLPRWVFTRGTVWVILATLVISLIFPTVVSTMLLLFGFAVVVFGAVLYTDTGLAVKVLPGRATATHVLIGGVGFLVIGFALAVFTS